MLVVQALLLADGGITALGTNITLLGIVGVVVGWLVFRGLQAVLPKRLGLNEPERLAVRVVGPSAPAT